MDQGQRIKIKNLKKSADFRGLTRIYKEKSPQIARMPANNDEDT
jgi:hypothetical protein